jgi:hypothetical protein
MNYASKQAAIDDIIKAGLAYLGETITGSGDFPRTHEVKLLVQARTNDGYSVAEYAHQGMFELADGTTYLGEASNRTRGGGINPHVRNYLLLKDVIADDSLTGTVSEVKAAIEAKTVRKNSANNISLRSLQVAVGLTKWATIKSYLDGIVTAGGENSAVVTEVLNALDPNSPRLTVDPTTDEYRTQVDSIRLLVNGAAGEDVMTADDADAMKAIGEEPWTVQHGVILWDHQISNIIG